MSAPFKHFCKSPVLAVFNLIVLSTTHAVAALSPPLGCGGVYGVGGCPPYSQIFFQTGDNNGNLFEYDASAFSYSVSGSTATVYGAVDMTSGYLGVSASGLEDGNPSTGTGGIVSVSVTDVFTLHSTSSGPVSFSAVLNAEGIGNITNPGYSGQVTIQLGLQGGAGDYDTGVFQAGTHAPLGTPFSLTSTISGAGLEASYAYAIMPDTPFVFGYSLRADVSQGTVFDLSNSGYLRFILPAGVTITSMGGYSSAIVPLPAAAWLFGTGMLGLIAVARARKHDSTTRARPSLRA